MSFDTSLHLDERVATVRWSGELDSRSAPRAQALIEDAAGRDLEQLVVDMAELSYLASAGLRCLVFAHQKLDSEVEIVLVGAQPEVAETIRLTGFDRSVTMVDAPSTP